MDEKSLDAMKEAMKEELEMNLDYKLKVVVAAELIALRLSDYNDNVPEDKRLQLLDLFLTSTKAQKLWKYYDEAIYMAEDMLQKLKEDTTLEKCNEIYLVTK